MPLDGLAHSTLSLAWFLVKTALVIWLIFWIRGTFPRLRIDQLMSFGWKLLVPLSFLNIIATAVVLFYGWPLWSLSIISLLLLGGTVYIIFRNPGTDMRRETVRVVSARDLRRTPTATRQTPESSPS